MTTVPFHFNQTASHDVMDGRSKVGKEDGGIIRGRCDYYATFLAPRARRRRRPKRRPAGPAREGRKWLLLDEGSLFFFPDDLIITIMEQGGRLLSTVRSILHGIAERIFSLTVCCMDTEYSGTKVGATGCNNLAGCGRHVSASFLCWCGFHPT